MAIIMADLTGEQSQLNTNKRAMLCQFGIATQIVGSDEGGEGKEGSQVAQGIIRDPSIIKQEEESKTARKLKKIRRGSRRRTRALTFPQGPLIISQIKFWDEGPDGFYARNRRLSRHLFKLNKCGESIYLQLYTFCEQSCWSDVRAFSLKPPVLKQWFEAV